jgi:hypothetical protein
MKRVRCPCCARRSISGKDAPQLVPLRLPYPILGGPQCPSRREARARERHRSLTEPDLDGSGPGGAHYAAVLAALKNKPAAAAKDAAVLDRCSARQPQACTGRDGGMAAAEQRNASLSWSNRLFLRERAELRRASRRLTSEGRIEKQGHGRKSGPVSLGLALPVVSFSSTGALITTNNSRISAILPMRLVLAITCGCNQSRFTLAIGGYPRRMCNFGGGSAYKLV